MEKKENASKLISSLVALSLATTLGVPTIALADEGQSAGGEQPAASATTGSAETPAEANGNDTGNAQSGETDIAEMNETEVTLSTGKYTISKSVAKSITVSKGATVEISIPNKDVTLTNTEGKHTITNDGTLTITGSGTIDNVSHARGALVNDPGATATLNGCTFTRSKEAGTDSDHANGNSWYTIKNYGTMTINKGVVVNQGADGKGKFSSLVANGWQNGNENTAKDAASLKINGGTFSGGLNVIKNDDWGRLEITGGTFASFAQSALLNWNEAIVTGGTFEKDSSRASLDAVILNGKLDNVMDKGSLTITDGEFVSNRSVIGWMNGSKDNTIGNVEISGGTFSSTDKNAKLFDLAQNDSKTVVKIKAGTFSAPEVYQYADYSTQQCNINVTLNDDCSDVVVPANVKTKLDLAGHTVSSSSDHALTNNGELTVTDSSENAGGAIDGGATASKGALYNAPAGKAEIQAGKLQGSKWYVVKNLGDLTISGTTTLEQKDAGSSAIDNGYYGEPDNDCGLSEPKSATVALSILGGTFSGGMNTVKNDDFGVLTIADGTFSNTNGPTVLNWHKATINGGSFSVAQDAASVFANGYLSDAADAGQFTINGGTFTSGKSNALYGYGEGTKQGGFMKITGGTFTGVLAADNSYPSTPKVSGGTFSAKPDASYIADGYEAAKSGDNWVVQVPYTPAPAPSTETTTTTNPDGTTTTTVTDKKTGESTSTTEGANGTTVVKRTDASGNTTTEVTVPEGAATNAGAPVEIPAAAEVAKGEQVSVSAPAGTVVALPVASAGAGDVAVIAHADGTETVIPMSLVEGGKAIVKLDGNETVKIVDNAKDFSDVPAEHWAADDIDFASSHEIFKGIGNGDTYEPETALTRNMMMTVLARTDGADTSDSDPWYAKGQQWAVENGVSNGLWGEDSITREQLVTMLFNYANKSGMDTSARADVSGMENADAVSSWATEAVQWAVAEGILKGVDNTDLAPQGLATRAQAAAFMQRYVKAALL